MPFCISLSAIRQALAACTDWMAAGRRIDPHRKPVRYQSDASGIRDWPGSVGIPSICNDYVGSVERPFNTDGQRLNELLGQSVSQDTCNELLRKFGSLDMMIHADPDVAFRALHGMSSVSLATALQQILDGRLSAARPLRSVISSALDLAPRLQLQIGGRRIETFVVTFLDSANHILAEEIMWSGTIDTVPVYPREVVRRAVALDASALILAHNHPSQQVLPSGPDWQITQNIMEAAGLFNIAIIDHLVISRGSFHSMRFHSESDLWQLNRRRSK
jgi:DNA repair protein RadC